MHFSNGFSCGCVIYHRFLYRLQKIVILKSNYCQGKFHLFFAIEHAQKLKSLVKVAENPCWEWNFRAECQLKIYTHPWLLNLNCANRWLEMELLMESLWKQGSINKVGVILALPEWILFCLGSHKSDDN